jgi:hypothetical protein
MTVIGAVQRAEFIAMATKELQKVLGPDDAVKAMRCVQLVNHSAAVLYCQCCCTKKLTS